MAGGIDWFRWHHGSVTDPKFQLVARNAGARLGDVIAVWAFILERASADADRGHIGRLDFEALDFMLGAEDGTSVRILDAMTARGLIGGSRIASWEERQPKREREDDSSTDRVRAFRERKRQETPGNAKERQQAPRNATGSQETPRGEERREEPPSTEGGSARGRASPVARPEEVTEQTWADWLHLRKSKRAPVTQTVVDGARKQAQLAGMSLEAFLQVWCRRGSQGLEAEWLKPEERGSPRAPPTFANKHSAAAAGIFPTRQTQEVIDV